MTKSHVNLALIFERNVPDFKIVKNEDAPDWVPRTHIFNGRESIIGTAYVYANLEPAELIKATEKMRRMPTKDL